MIRSLPHHRSGPLPSASAHRFGRGLATVAPRRATLAISRPYPHEPTCAKAAKADCPLGAEGSPCAPVASLGPVAGLCAPAAARWGEMMHLQPLVVGRHLQHDAPWPGRRAGLLGRDSLAK